jgi:RNA polymerase sigma-70 factor (ECF subfamily)
MERRKKGWPEITATGAAACVREVATFEEIVLPHLGAAQRLARWLLRNEHDADDVVQEASLRALRYFRTFVGGDGRAWFLRIVRNTCRSRFTGCGANELFEEERHSVSRSARAAPHNEAAILVEQTMANLPLRVRELLALRELEGLSYRELADVMDVPIGTVMSSLSRARHAFRVALETGQKQRGAPQRTRVYCDSRSLTAGVYS